MDGIENEDTAWAAWDKDRRDERWVWEAMRDNCIWIYDLPPSDRGCDAPGHVGGCAYDACPLLKETDDA